MRADGGVELWLADVGGTAGWEWPVPRLARFAYELGVAQARWTGRVPDLRWLSRRWLAQYLAEGPGRLTRVDDADWDHPSVAVWPAAGRRRLRELWADPSRLTAIAGPPTGRYATWTSAISSNLLITKCDTSPDLPESNALMRTCCPFISIGLLHSD